jgi:TolB-like protein/tetratricopeptide (TPR) repeat protein
MLKADPDLCPMRYRFDAFELDTDRFTLAHEHAPVHVEPLVFDLLRFVVEHAGEVVDRDTLIAQVWKGRIVSDATVSSCIKSARRALGDSGERQRYLKTTRGRGFQFAAAVTRVAETGGNGVSPAASAERARAVQASPCAAAPPRIAVLPFHALAGDAETSLLGDALAQEVILELSRLRSLFVIARGSSFQLRGADVDTGRAGSVLGADYIVTGTLLRQEHACVVAVELCHASDSAVIWAERFSVALGDLVHMRSTLAAEIVGALEARVQLNEALTAAAVPTERLDAWSAYHRGLWHMYRFNKRDNAVAASLFARALELDPRFARAHAGLSFTHFQEAFLAFSGDAAGEKRLMRAHAEAGLALDPLDPLVNLTMGRAEWLGGDVEASLPWIERSVRLSPNYAFAIYNGALVGTLLGEGEANEAKVAKAIALSPIDPLSYAMLATRALTHVVRGDLVPAAEWAERAVRAPNAHVQIFMVAAFTSELLGRREKADAFVRDARRLNPAASVELFLRSFPFRDASLRQRIAGSLARLGL